jgi:hypothetical protein
MSGDKFIKSLLQPIASLFDFFVQAGWPIDAVFSIGVRSLNGLNAGSQVQLQSVLKILRFFRSWR